MGGCLDDLGILLLVYYSFNEFYLVGARPASPALQKEGKAGLAPTNQQKIKPSPALWPAWSLRSTVLYFTSLNSRKAVRGECMGSVIKKRRKKIARHKYRKMRKLMKFQRRK